MKNQHIALVPLTFTALLFALPIMLQSCEAYADDTAAVWLARSCIGEAGFDSVDTGECAALLHIYKKRSKIGRRSILQTALKYSAAIKPGAHHRNRWIRHLKGDDKPRNWPRGLKWKAYHRDKWRETLAYASRFLRGGVADPLPKALHYGSQIDHWRAVREGWRRIPSSFKNYFYIVPGVKI